MNRRFGVSMVGLAWMLAACGDQARSVGADAPPYAGPSGSMATFAAPGWKPGDKTSWEQGMKVRTQYGQNDHTR